MIIVVLFVFGLAWGSFVNALIWRLHETQKLSKKSKTSSKLSIWRGRSMCTSCKHELAAIDLVPVFSWLALRGKCRYCKKHVTWQYPVVELLVAALFVISYMYWPYQVGTSYIEVALFSAWLPLIILGTALSLYDLKWMELPNRLVYTFGIFAILWCVLLSIYTVSYESTLAAVIGSMGFGGLFYLIYQVSNGKWIGGGDVRLGFVLGLILGWQKSIIGLMLAAYLATAVILVLVLMRKYHKKMHLPFGPFLLTAGYIVVLWGGHIIEWYKNVSGLSG